MLRPRWICFWIIIMQYGCGAKPPAPPTVHPATGVVKFTNGQPFVGGIISLTSTADPRNVVEAAIGDDGTFELAMVFDNRRLIGAQEGTYDVLVSARFQAGKGVAMYHLPGAAVIKSGPNQLTIQVDPAKARY